MDSDFRALQLHPNKPGLYILAASHELDHSSPSSARTLLQRGIRLNPESVDIWREYVRMELGFIESLRRRWDVLGIKEKADENREGAGSRQDIMQGAIVKSVMNSAVQGAVGLFNEMMIGCETIYSAAER